MADLNQIAHRVVQRVADANKEDPSASQLNGHRGGIKGGKARADKLSPEERSQIARHAAEVRWAGRK